MPEIRTRSRSIEAPSTDSKTTESNCFHSRSVINSLKSRPIFHFSKLYECEIRKYAGFRTYQESGMMPTGFTIHGLPMTRSFRKEIVSLFAIRTLQCLSPYQNIKRFNSSWFISTLNKEKSNLRTFSKLLNFDSH